MRRRKEVIENERQATTNKVRGAGYERRDKRQATRVDHKGQTMKGMQRRAGQ